MSWVTLQLFSLILNSANSVLDKRLVRDHEANPVMYLASFALVGLPVVLIGLFIVPWSGYKAAGAGLLTGLIFTGIVLLYYKAMSLDDVSQLVPILRLSSLLNLLFLAIFLDDTLSTPQYVAAGCMLMGTLALSWRKKKEGSRHRIGKGMVLMAIVAFLSAINGLLNSHLNLAYTPLVLLVWSQAGNVLGLLFVLMLRQQRQALRHSLTTSSRHFQMCIIGEQIVRLITGILSDFALHEAGSAAIVSVIGGFRPFVVLLLAVIFLQERFTRQEILPKLVGIGLMTVGTCFLLLAK